MIFRHAGVLQGFTVTCKPCLPRYLTRRTTPALGRCLYSPTSKHQIQQHIIKRRLEPVIRTYSSFTGQNDLSQARHDEEGTIGGSPVVPSVAEPWPRASSDGLIQAARSTPLVYQRSRRRKTRARRPAATFWSLHRKSSNDRPFKFVSLGLWGQSRGRSGHFEKFSSLVWTWYRALARIRNGQVAILNHVALGSLGSKYIGQTEHQMLDTWKEMYSILKWATIQKIWQRVMLWTLQHDHGKALTFLEATISDAHNRAGATRYAIEGALEFLVSKYFGSQVIDKELQDRFHRLFCRFAEASDLGNNRVSSSIQKIIYLLLRHSDDHQAEILYEEVVNSKLKLHCNSLTHFMDKFARIGRPYMAMDALRRIAVSAADLSSDTVQCSCVTLLRSSFGNAERYRIQSHLVTEMLEMGIRSGIRMLNAMILNAVEAGDYQTAYAIFETARIHGIRRDTITYSTLLKIALHSLDESLVKNIMLMAEEDGALPRNNQLVFCLVATIMQIARAESQAVVSWASRYRTMIQVYARYCDIRPLQELGIYVNVFGDFGSAGRPISQPSPQLLSVMIMAYIQLFRHPSPIQELYHRWQALLAQNHLLIAPTAETDHLANAFLFSLGQSRATFTMCPTILRNMLEPPASTTVRVAKPTVQTWSILLRSYFFNGQRAAAEKIVQMMRERGIKPNTITMNTIIAGYARMQDAAAAVNAMQQMEAAGLEADSSTYKGLTRVVERDQLLEALRRAAVKTEKALEDVQATEDCTKADPEVLLDDPISGAPGDANLLSPEAPGSNQQLLPTEASQQSRQGDANGMLHQLIAHSENNGRLQQTNGQQKEACSDSDAPSPVALDFEGDDSHLYEILDTPPEASW